MSQLRSACDAINKRCVHRGKRLLKFEVTTSRRVVITSDVLTRWYRKLEFRGEGEGYCGCKSERVGRAPVKVTDVDRREGKTATVESARPRARRACGCGAMAARGLLDRSGRSVPCWARINASRVRFSVVWSHSASLGDKAGPGAEQPSAALASTYFNGWSNDRFSSSTRRAARWIEVDARYFGGHRGQLVSEECSRSLDHVLAGDASLVRA